MRRNATFVLPILVGLMSIAHATPAITVGDFHFLQERSPTQTDTIDVFYDTTQSGGGNLQGQTIYISIADEGNGGLSDADPGEPFIASVDGITGTVWTSNNTGQVGSFVNNQLFQYNITTSTGTVSASGKLLSVTINRNGAIAGGPMWGLRVFVGVPELSGPYASNWSDGANIGVNFNSQDTPSGWNGVTGVPDGAFFYQPEPSSIVLGICGAIGLACARLRRHWPRPGRWRR